MGERINEDRAVDPLVVERVGQTAAIELVGGEPEDVPRSETTEEYAARNRASAWPPFKSQWI